MINKECCYIYPDGHKCHACATHEDLCYTHYIENEKNKIEENLDFYYEKNFFKRIMIKIIKKK